MTVTICESTDRGHRMGYVTYFKSEIAEMGQAAVVEPSLWRATWKRGPLVIPMLEQGIKGNILALLVRGLLGRRTLCLVFRAIDAAASGSGRHRAKRWLLAAVRRIPGAGLVSIVPASVEPQIAGFINGWIYDPELCDLSEETLNREPGERVSAIKAQAAGRVLVVSLGALSEQKGFGYFARLWSSSAALRERCLFVAAGPVPEGMKASAQSFVADGGVLLDERIDDAVLFDFYAAADVIWCCYAPDYDQASGIFGRAVQFGKTALLRSGSHVERFAAVVGQPAASLVWDDDAGAVDCLLSGAVPKAAVPPGRLNIEMTEHNRRVLRDWLL